MEERCSEEYSVEKIVLLALVDSLTNIEALNNQGRVESKGHERSISKVSSAGGC